MDADDWASISDPFLRRRAQNRIAQRKYRKRRQKALEKLMQDRCSCQKQKHAKDRIPEGKGEDLLEDRKGKEQLCALLEGSPNSSSTPSEDFLMIPWSPVNLDCESNLLEQDNDHAASSLGDSPIPSPTPSPTPSDTGSTDLTGSHIEMWLPNPFTQAFVKLPDLDLAKKC